MSSAEDWRAWEGRMVAGKFPLRQWLGGSAHSAVFLTERQAKASQAPQKAAIKLISGGAGVAERQLSRWCAAAQLSHPNLIRILESGRCQFNGTPLLYVVMEYAEEDLSQILPQRALTPAEAADLLPPLLDALSYLHEKGFVHGDIRPSNLLAAGDQLKLSADQVTSDPDPDPGRRRRDVYDAPETEAGTLSPASDLWSVGATLVAALTQNANFPGEASPEVAALQATIPEPFRGIARECLRLDPKRRCSIAEITARLQPPGRSVPVQPEPLPPARPFVSKGTIGAAVVVAVLLIGLIALYPRRKSTPAGSEVAPEPTASAPAPTPSAGETPTPSKKTLSQGEVLRRVLPDIPRSAMDTITGTIKITAQVEVDPSGKVTAAKLTSSGPSQYFANLVLKAVQGWEFTPPEVAGQPAASTWLLRFRLRRNAIDVSPERVTR